MSLAETSRRSRLANLLVSHRFADLANLSGDLSNVAPVRSAATAPNMNVRKAPREIGLNSRLGLVIAAVLGSLQFAHPATPMLDLRLQSIGHQVITKIAFAADQTGAQGRAQALESSTFGAQNQGVGAPLEQLENPTRPVKHHLGVAVARGAAKRREDRRCSKDDLDAIVEVAVVFPIVLLLRLRRGETVLKAMV